MKTLNKHNFLFDKAMFHGNGAQRAFAKELLRQEIERQQKAAPDVKEHDPSMNKKYAEAYKSEVKYLKKQSEAAQHRENKTKRSKQAKTRSPGVGRGGIRKNKRRK